MKEIKLSDLSLSAEDIKNLQRVSKRPESMSSDDLVKQLEPFFYIESEVQCKHFAAKGRKRIDFVIKPKNIGRWKRPDLIFGVEVKRKDRSKLGEFTKHFGQSVDYANSVFNLSKFGDRFDRFVGYLPILTFPTFVPMDCSPQCQVELTAVLRRMASSVGVGEIGWFKKEPQFHDRQSPIEDGFGIVWQGHPLWWSHSGTTLEGYTWPIKRKFGSR